MLKPCGPKPNARFQPFRWLLVFMAVLFITLETGIQHRECDCQPGTAEVVAMCELDEQECLPLLINTEIPALAEPKSTYVAPPSEELSDLDLDPRHPPPRRG
jgi:hypothetical protein